MRERGVTSRSMCTGEGGGGEERGKVRGVRGREGDIEEYVHQ